MARPPAVIDVDAEPEFQVLTLMFLHMYLQ